MEGQCMCGAVTISAELSQDKLTACHCEMCRRWASGAFMAVSTKPGSVRVQGPARAVQSSDWAERGFCADCGSNLWYRMTDPEGEHHLSAGLFDTGDMPIGLEVWIDRKPAGYGFAGTSKKMTAAECLAMFTAPKNEGEPQ